MEKISDTMGVSIYDAYAAEQNNLGTTLSERVKKAQENMDDRNMRQREKEKNIKNLQGLVLTGVRLDVEVLPEENTVIALKQGDGKLSQKNLHEAKGHALNKFDLSQASLDDLANSVRDIEQEASSANLLSKLRQSNISSADLSKKITEKDTSATNNLLPQGNLAPLLTGHEQINDRSHAAQTSSVALANNLHQARLFSAMQSQTPMSLNTAAETSSLTYRFDKWGAAHSVSVSSIDGRGDLADVAATAILRPSDNLVEQRLTTHLSLQEHGSPSFLVKDHRDQSSDRQPSQQDESSERKE